MGKKRLTKALVTPIQAVPVAVTLRGRREAARHQTRSLRHCRAAWGGRGQHRVREQRQRGQAGKKWKTLCIKNFTDGKMNNNNSRWGKRRVPRPTVALAQPGWEGEKIK